MRRHETAGEIAFTRNTGFQPVKALPQLQTAATTYRYEPTPQLQTAATTCW
ncbi:MAG: hypothetical protein AAFR61_27220 [Bacteroidota bacterium]